MQDSCISLSSLIYSCKPYLRAAKLVEIGYNIKMMIQVLLFCPCVLTARVSPPYSGHKRPAARIDRPSSICGGKEKAAYELVLWTSAPAGVIHLPLQRCMRLSPLSEINLNGVRQDSSPTDKGRVAVCVCFTGAGMRAVLLWRERGWFLGTNDPLTSGVYGPGTTQYSQHILKRLQKS